MGRTASLALFSLLLACSLGSLARLLACREFSLRAVAIKVLAELLRLQDEVEAFMSLPLPAAVAQEGAALSEDRAQVQQRVGSRLQQPAQQQQQQQAQKAGGQGAESSVPQPQHAAMSEKIVLSLGRDGQQAAIADVGTAVGEGRWAGVAAFLSHRRLSRLRKRDKL